MNNVQKYEHWYWMGIVARDTNSVLEEYNKKTWNNLEWQHQKLLDAKIKFYDKLIKLGDNKK